MTESKRILHVEDSDTDAKLIAAELRRLWRESRCERAQTAPAVERALEQGPWDVILCDWSMPDLTAFTVFEIVKRRGLDIPIIIVSGTIGEEAAVAAMRGGASDYILKDDLARLGPVIEREMREHEQRQARRKAEEALHAVERRYKRIVETTNQGILWIDAESKLTFVNARLGAMLGYAPDELIGSSFFDLMDDESRAEVKRSIAESRAGVGGRADRRVIRKDGTRVWVHSEWTPIFDDAGRYEGRLAMFTDLSEMKRMDDALRVTQGRLARLAETGVMGMLVANTSGAVVEANEAALKMLGFTRDDVANGTMNWIALTPPEWKRVNDEIVEALRLTGHAAPREKEYFRKDGTRVPVLVGVAAIDAPYAIAILIELSEQKRAERALHASESRFARLLQSGLIGIAFADVHGNVHEVNDAYLHILGFERADLAMTSMNWAAMTPPEWLAIDLRAVEQLKKTGIATPWEKELYGKGGRPVPVLIGVAMLDEVNCIAFITDLTDRKRAESALRRSEEQLRQAQKMEAIGILAGGVAHDFNNILSVILSYSELLLDELLSEEEMRSGFEQIKLAGERASGLTRQLLAFSRQQIIAPKIVDLNEIVAHLDKLLRRLIREDIELKTLPAKGLGNCKCDPGQIEQVLMNLVVNARDAMPEGGRLTIETSNVELDESYAAAHLGTRLGHYVMLAVSDTGTGMDKATQARIFEPFFTTKEKGKGTGLGLSTVFGIVEQSQGTIWVYSEPGRGTTFKIYLPRTDEAKAAAEARRQSSVLTGTETVLLVEDEDQIRDVARAVLQRAGYRVVVARNGGEALIAGEQHEGEIDLLLTDVVMPVMNGKQLADRLRAIRPSMKVLFMSGYTDGALVGELAAGAAFLQKPLTPAALMRLVRETLDRPAPL